MTFDANSFLVQFWVKQIRQGTDIKDVPVIYNLKDVVASLI